jgi:adenylate cyclase
MRRAPGISRRIVNRLAVAAVLATCGTVVLLLVSGIGVLHDLLDIFEKKTLDYRMAHYRGALVAEGAALTDVVIVDVDEKSLAELGQFFRWPRYYHAAVIDSLAAGGARAIGFDILFPEPDRMPRSVVAHYAALLSEQAGWRQSDLEQVLSTVGGDSLFAAAIARSERVILGASIVATHVLGSPDSARISLLPPVPSLARAAVSLGHVQVLPDGDGIVRRVRAVLSDGKVSLPALGLRLALKARGQSAEAISLSPDGFVRGEGWDIPTDHHGNVLLDYAGPDGTFLRIPYVDVLKGRIPGSLFRDRIVLIGATASGLMDHFASPFSPHHAGVAVHATLAHNILSGRYIEVSEPAWDWAVTWLLAFLAGAVVLTVSPVWAGLAALGLVGAHTVVCFERFAASGVWASFTLPAAGWLLCAVSAAFYRYWTEERSKLAIKRAFSRYLAPSLVEDIANSPDKLGLGGDEREVTIGFIDIRGFTTLSEGMTAGQLAHFLNDYLSVMTATILEEEGTVDKYIGDAIMMLYGAPVSVDDHAAKACRTGLAMQKAVVENQTRWREYGLPDVQIGVGLNTGIAAIGNMGSSFRFDYTAMGDPVNLASRLEGLNKVYGTELIVGPETQAATRESFCYRELDFVRVKGKTEPVRIYELLGTSDCAGAMGEFVTRFEGALQHFRDRSWDCARALLEGCLSQRPEDGPSRFLLAGVDKMVQNPPPDDWDGVSTMETK